jgi:hypothetical protein
VRFASLPASDVNVTGVLWLAVAQISTVSVNEIMGLISAKHMDVKSFTSKDWKV